MQLLVTWGSVEGKGQELNESCDHVGSAARRGEESVFNGGATKSTFKIRALLRLKLLRTVRGTRGVGDINTTIYRLDKRCTKFPIPSLPSLPSSFFYSTKTAPIHPPMP